MKSLATAICLLAATLPFLPVPNSVPLEVRIDIKPRTAGGIIPVRTMPYHASATVRQAGVAHVIGTVDLDLQPGQTITREETVEGYRITFQSKIATDGLRAAAVATVRKGDQIVTRQSSDVSLER